MIDLLAQRTDVAIHGEDAIGDDELVARLVLDFLEQFFAMGHIFVAEDFDFGT